RKPQTITRYLLFTSGHHCSVYNSRNHIVIPNHFAMTCTFIPKFDVFLSFSGEEITKTFVQDLNRSLSEKGVTTYQKDDKLEDKISPLGSDLTKCITESKLVVVVISRSYPTSVLCLNHLETIIKSHDQGRFPVLPIFYGVNPSNVRKQSGEVEEPFRKLCEEYPADKVQTWRTALTKLTNISSLESRYWNIEAKAIEFITKEILHLISKKPKAIKDDGLVALDRHMQALYKLLDLQSQEEVRLIGIWGLRGVGKTTLARYAYEELSTNFHAHMFIDDAQKIFHQDHRTSKETQKAGMNLNLSYDVIKSTVGHRKGLLVIDCVEDVKQLKSITYIVGWCGPGSRVILVTEEKSLIEEFGVKHIYQVKSLRYHEALQLFSQSAFNKKNPPASFASLSFRAVQVADFLPLTLKILGSSLQGKNHLTWERELKKLEGDQEKAITKALDVNGDVALEPHKPSAFPISPTSSPYVTSSQLSSQAARRL
ncbi:unnamed protein product, partial [Arabidopsis halleri]